MQAKVNCIHNDNGAWCTNKNIKRSLFGFGARICTEYPRPCDSCPFQEKYPKGTPPKNL